MRVAFLFVLIVACSFAQGQSYSSDPAKENYDNITLAFDQKDFNGQFSVFYSSEGDYNYYVIDLTRFSGRFERVYFMNLTYADSRIVNLDGDLDKSLTWYKAYHAYKESEIKCLFDDLKAKTETESLKMTDDEKSAWMVNFDKFKKSGKDE